jgi:aspartyl-tRNA(Asn)/glutamyl-tRNA(Gln) amidotransferase subunit A
VVLDGLEDAPARAFDDAVARLAGAGARIVDLDLPRLARAYDLGTPLYASEAWAAWRDVIGEEEARVFPPVMGRLAAGKTVLAADYLAAWEELRAFRAEAWDRMAGLDAILCPTAPILPPLAAEVLADHELFRTRNLLALRNTRMANLLGLASISVPTGTPSCGLMLSGLPGREGGLLRMAHAVSTLLA